MKRVLAQLVAKRSGGRANVGARAGIGISARFLDLGRVELLFVDNSGRLRMAGLSSWAGHPCFGDANQIVLDMGERVILPDAQRAPVIAGVRGIDPTRRMARSSRGAWRLASPASSTTRRWP